MKYDKKQLLAAVDSVFDDAVSLRRQLHMHPELSEQETETARLIALQLQDLGIPYETGIAGNGISAVIYGKDRTCGVGIRADMDALPITELVEIPFKSQNPGVMHACGHDIHTAILLGTCLLYTSGGYSHQHALRVGSDTLGRVQGLQLLHQHRENYPVRPDHRGHGTQGEAGR